MAVAALKDYIRRIRGMRESFRRCFLGPNGLPTNDGHVVLAELRRFCYGAKPTILRGTDGKVDPYASIAAAGRQEVYQRIVLMLNINDRDIVMMERQAQQGDADG